MPTCTTASTRRRGDFQHRPLTPRFWSARLGQVRDHSPVTDVAIAAAQLAEVRRLFAYFVDGMTDEELLWEPVDGCWLVRERDGKWVFEVVKSDPEPPPLTTVGWLIAHMTQFLFVAAHAVRGSSAEEWPRTFGTASEAVAEWSARAEALARALEEAAEEHFARDYVLSAGAEPNNVGSTVWRTIFELTHHGAEVSRMRHLYANRSTLGADGDAGAAQSCDVALHGADADLEGGRELVAAAGARRGCHELLDQSVLSFGSLDGERGGCPTQRLRSHSRHTGGAKDS